MLPRASPGPWHLAVYALAMVDGEPVISPGLGALGPDRRARPESRGDRLLHLPTRPACRAEPGRSPSGPSPPAPRSRRRSWSPTRGPSRSRPTTARSSPSSPPAQDGATFPLPPGVEPHPAARPDLRRPPRRPRRPAADPPPPPRSRRDASLRRSDWPTGSVRLRGPLALVEIPKHQTEDHSQSSRPSTWSFN